MPIAPPPTFSQTVVDNKTGVDVKQYAMDDFSDPTVSFQVLAGTVYPSVGLPSIHFIAQNYAGGIVTSTSYKEPNRELRSVDIAAMDKLNIFITAQHIDKISGVGIYKILLLKVDIFGNLLSEQIIESPLLHNGTDYSEIIPLNSYLFNNQLYICGFITTNNLSTSELNWGPQDTRKAFVLRYDPVSQTVTNAMTYDYTFTPTGGLTQDYDMALRIQKLSNGNLFVTGSANTVIGVTWRNFVDEFLCGTLNLEINPFTLMDVHNMPFVNETFLLMTLHPFLILVNMV